jgi:hypothetical protein
VSFCSPAGFRSTFRLRWMEGGQSCKKGEARPRSTCSEMIKLAISISYDFDFEKGVLCLNGGVACKFQQ